MDIEKINVKLPDISDIDVGYAAGFYEGEGSCIAMKNDGCYITITQKDSEPLVKLQNLFGGKISLYNGYHYWRLFGDECKAFIVLVFEHLSIRRKEQILKHEEYLYAVESCPNGHPYIDGSYKVTEDSRGRIYRSCIECLEANTKRKNDPVNRSVIMLANLHGISKEEALELWNKGKDKKNEEVA